ncbi:hypothetical protein ACU6VG_13790 [Sphaerotilus sulfidivorans]|uniref:hypothetical protein n=1 Tax=Sphaerotilus sp. FB-3 TaxID=2913396 RepID=UPI00203A9250|nr:hypothetical protein [Sphaerotilus sp. FB-3]
MTGSMRTVGIAASIAWPMVSVTLPRGSAWPRSSFLLASISMAWRRCSSASTTTRMMKTKSRPIIRSEAEAR